MKITATNNNTITFKPFKITLEITIESLKDFNDTNDDLLDYDINEYSKNKLTNIQKIIKEINKQLNEQVKSK